MLYFQLAQGRGGRKAIQYKNIIQEVLNLDHKLKLALDQYLSADVKERLWPYI